MSGGLEGEIVFGGLPSASVILPDPLEGQAVFFLSGLHVTAERKEWCKLSVCCPKLSVTNLPVIVVVKRTHDVSSGGH